MTRAERRRAARGEGAESKDGVRITACAECGHTKLCYLPARLCEKCLLRKPEGQELLLELIALSEERTEPVYGNEENESMA